MGERHYTVKVLKLYQSGLSYIPAAIMPALLVDPIHNSEYDNVMKRKKKLWKMTNRAVGSSSPAVSGVVTVLCMVAGLGLSHWPVEARDLMVPKEQATTEYEPTETPSLDVQRKGIPQSLFTWIKMARGYDVEWDTFGRKGWYTQDPRLKPIDPDTTVFAPDTPAVYIVFEVAPLEDPAQFAAQVFPISAEGKTAELPVVHDSLEVPGHERYGFLELKKPSDRWPSGQYLVKIFITSLGQQPFHAVNQVGTMHFEVTDRPLSGSTSPVQGSAGH